MNEKYTTDGLISQTAEKLVAMGYNVTIEKPNEEVIKLTRHDQGQMHVSWEDLSEQAPARNADNTDTL